MTNLAHISAVKDQTLRLLPAPAPLDDALRQLAGHGPALRNGYFDHGPMAVEALEAMGLSHRIGAYAREHLAQGGVTPATKPVRPILKGQWSTALGRAERYGDWAALIAQELEAMGWRALAQRWVVRLTPGAATAALHGLIRTAHAVRALGRRDSPARQNELVQALASWACLYTPAPWPGVAGNGALAPNHAFDAITPAPEAQRAPAGSISAGLGCALHAPDFTMQLAQVDISGAPGALADVMLETFARAFLKQARSSYTAIVWCHALTATASAQRLFGVLSEDEARTLLARVFEVGCAMKAAFTDLHDDANPDRGHLDPPDILAQRAAEAGDDHAIKITDALLEAHGRRAKAIFLEAADRGIRLLGV